MNADKRRSKNHRRSVARKDGLLRRVLGSVGPCSGGPAAGT